MCIPHPQEPWAKEMQIAKQLSKKRQTESFLALTCAQSSTCFETIEDYLCEVIRIVIIIFRLFCFGCRLLSKNLEQSVFGLLKDRVPEFEQACGNVIAAHW
mmetsp:Transcript_32894/g.99159  ORF Transcript_32894/g.99159 Transcript_32894/m.99159 type:complete len:101 (-) Transcript_32894:12851-13153(-)